MLRVVLDTNVLVSAVTSPMGLCATLMLRRSEGSFQVVASPRLIEELQRTLAGPKFADKVPADDAQAFAAFVERSSLMVDDPPKPPKICRDRSDDFVLALAREGQALVIVTGDKDLLTLQDFPISIRSPRAFLEELP